MNEENYKTAEATEKKKNIYFKLRDARRTFLHSGVEQSGYNQHADFDYFELEDIIPKANEAFDREGLLLYVTFMNGECVGVLVDMEDPNTSLTFCIPHAKIAEPAKFRMNEMQALGAETTYLRRYMYMVVLDIIQSDGIDIGRQDEAPAVKPEKKSTPKTKKSEKSETEAKIVVSKPKKPATAEERSEIKKDLTNADGKADELQIGKLKSLAMKWAMIDDDCHEKATALMVKTNAFADCSRKEADILIDKITQAIEKAPKKEE